jgi:hypothetical protein
MLTCFNGSSQSADRIFCGGEVHRVRIQFVFGEHHFGELDGMFVAVANGAGCQFLSRPFTLLSTDSPTSRAAAEAIEPKADTLRCA